MIDVYTYVVQPFIDYSFMQRALMGTLLLSISACPIGVFLTLRRMSLTGDAMSHAILPGVALGFLFFGLELIPMTLGGLAAGLTVALGAGAVSRLTIQKEDASLAAFYLISLALGVLIVSMRGSNVDLMHVLFGTVLALDNASLYLIAGVSGLTLALIILLWRALIAECFDPLFLRSVSRIGPLVHFTFLALVVLNLVAGFQALGTLLVVGLMIIPAASAHFWCSRVKQMCALAIVIGAVSSACGLLLSYHAGVASGPAIILSAGLIYIVSLLGGRHGVVATHRKPTAHRVA